MSSGHPFATTSRERLATATRHLVDAVLTSEGVGDADMDEAAAAIEELADRLHGDAAQAERPVGRRTYREPDHAGYLPRSPLVGGVNPVSPPLDWSFDEGRIVATGVFGSAHEGPPGYVHGGWIALAFDEALGMINIANDVPGMTGKLSVRYRAPTPLHTPVRLESWTEHVEGRRIVARGTLSVGDTLCAESDGLFVTIPPDLAAQYFGAKDDPEGTES